MKEIEQGDRTIEFSDFNAENLISLVKSTWDQREQIRQRLQPKIKELKEAASSSANLVVEYIK